MKAFRCIIALNGFVMGQAFSPAPVIADDSFDETSLQLKLNEDLKAIDKNLKVLAVTELTVDLTQQDTDEERDGSTFVPVENYINYMRINKQQDNLR